MDYSIETDFSGCKIKQTYFRDSKKCLFDPIRKIFVVETPEEIVRQQFIQFLLKEMNVPFTKIGVDVAMSDFKKRAGGRADIVIYGENKENLDVPIMLIECKAPNVSIVDDVWFQAYKYDNILGANYIVVTNGISTFAATWDSEDDAYVYVEELLTYQYLVEKNGLKHISNEIWYWKRPAFNIGYSKEVIEQFQEYCWLSESTEKILYSFIINLAGFIYDVNESCTPFNFDSLTAIEDGHRYTIVGNAAGGAYAGDYRYFILQDENGNNQIISMSIMATASFKNDPVFGNRKGNTTLNIAIDDFDKVHHSLQLNLDKYTVADEHTCTIWHDGTLTNGRKGAAKRKNVIKFVKERAPELIDSSDNVLLGTFDINSEIIWNQLQTRTFIQNIIKYALIRDEYRKI